MGTNATSTYTYKPVPWAVMPGGAAWGLILGFLYIPLFSLLYAYTEDALQGTELYAIVEPIEETVGVAGPAGVGFLFPIVGTLVVAYVGYRWRRYELGTDGITETRGMVFSSETFFSYDDVEEVTYTQSKTQSIYGAGTVRISEVDPEQEEGGKTMRLRYIRNPEAVYTNVLRNIADATGSTPGDLDVADLGESAAETEDISRMSSDDLAAGTGFRYLMPNTVLHPEPTKAASAGAALAVAYSVAGGGILWLARGILKWAYPIISSDLHVLGMIGLGTVAYAGILGGWYYWTYDKKQYELYDDHVRFIDGDERRTVALSDVAAVDRRDWKIQQWKPGHVALLDGDGNELLAFMYVSDPDSVYDSLKEWEESARGQRSDAPSGQETEPESSTESATEQLADLTGDVSSHADADDSSASETGANSPSDANERSSSDPDAGTDDD